MWVRRGNQVRFPVRRDICRETVAEKAASIIPGPDSPRIDAWLVNLCPTGVRLRLKTIVETDAYFKIQLRSNTATLGKVRCRPGADGFDISILMRDVTCSREARSLHVDDDELLLYLAGKLLTGTDIIRLKNHLIRCKFCRILLAKANSTLFAVGELGAF